VFIITSLIHPLDAVWKVAPLKKTNIVPGQCSRPKGPLMLRSLHIKCKIHTQCPSNSQSSFPHRYRIMRIHPSPFLLKNGTSIRFSACGKRFSNPNLRHYLTNFHSSDSYSTIALDIYHRRYYSTDPRRRLL